MPSYSWKCQDCADSVSVYRSIGEYEVAPSKRCPHCGSLDVACMVKQDGSKRRVYYCNECSGGTWDEQCSCGHGNWQRIMCAPVNRWRFCD